MPKRKVTNKFKEGEDPRDSKHHPTVDDIMQYLDKKPMTINNVLELTRIDRTKFFTSYAGFPRDGKEKPHKIAFVSIVCFVTGLHPTVFLLKDKETEDIWFDKWIEDKIDRNGKIISSVEEQKRSFFTNSYWNKLKTYYTPANALIEYISFKSEYGDHDKGLIKNYKRLRTYFNKPDNETIKVYEVLFKGHSRKPNEHSTYIKAQRHVLKAIKDWLDNKKEDNDKIITDNKIRIEKGQPLLPLKPYKYIRALAVSRSTFLFPKDGNTNLKQAMVLEASQQTLKHIKYCMDNHSGHCEFYATRTTRLRNHCIIDDKYALTEDYIISNIDDNFIIVPDGIFINDVCSTSKAFLFKKSLDTKKTFNGERLMKSDLYASLKKANTFIKEQANKKLNDAKRLEDLNFEDLSKQEREKRNLLLGYKNITLKKMTSIEYMNKANEEKTRKLKP